MLKRVATALVALLLALYGVVLVAVLAHASDYEVQRSVVIAAPPDVVLRHLDRRPSPGPWDPNTYESALHGVDSGMTARMTTVSLAATGRGTTTVTWRRTGKHGLFGAALRVPLGNEWVAGDIELALAHLKRIAEADGSAPGTASP